MTAMPAAKRLEADGRQGRLMRGYLHKTSNNLCGIKGYASLIAAGGVTPQAARWARQILAEVEQMENIYRSVQEIAFPPPAGPAAGDLAMAVAGAVAEVQLQHARLRARVRLGVSGALLLPARDLQLALVELLLNSAEAEPAGVVVEIACVVARSGRLALRVADDGPGFPPRVLTEAIAPFVTTKMGHLGVGLARVDTIMEMYGLPWSLANAPQGGAVVVLEAAQAPTVVMPAPSRMERGSHV